MDDNPKSRGLKHVQNKKRYGRGRSIPLVVQPKTKTVLPRESNWYRYEKKPVEEKLNSSMDFSMLANVPISKGSHFQFKHDKMLADEVDGTKPIHLFDLNLHLLNLSLSSIDFITRSDIDAESFSKNQKAIMQTNSTTNRARYVSYLNEKGIADVPEDFIFDNADPLEKEISDKEEKSIDEVDLIQPLSNKSPLLDDVETCSSLNEPEDSSCLKDSTEDSDLEKWLDAVLDD